MKRESFVRSGFLLLSCLIVLTAVMAMAVLSLTLSRLLWKASQIEIAHSESLNAQRAAIEAIQYALRTNRVPAVCWHQAVSSELSVAAFAKQPQLGCAFSLAHAKHYYWLTVLNEKPGPVGQELVAYHLLLISQMYGQSVKAERYGLAYKTVDIFVAPME